MISSIDINIGIIATSVIVLPLLCASLYDDAKAVSSNDTPLINIEAASIVNIPPAIVGNEIDISIPEKINYQNVYRFTVNPVNYVERKFSINSVIIPESIQFLNPGQLKVKNIFRTGNGIMELYGYKKK